MLQESRLECRFVTLNAWSSWKHVYNHVERFDTVHPIQSTYETSYTDRLPIVVLCKCTCDAFYAPTSAALYCNEQTVIVDVKARNALYGYVALFIISARFCCFSIRSDEIYLFCFVFTSCWSREYDLFYPICFDLRFALGIKNKFWEKYSTCGRFIYLNLKLKYRYLHVFRSHSWNCFIFFSITKNKLMCWVAVVSAFAGFT